MKFLYSLYHWLWAWTGSIVYGRPSRKLFMVGVTGTKGKTTVLELMDAILTAAGKKTALLSSIKRKIGEEEKENKLPNTMPGRWKMQWFLRSAVRAGCEYALIEVTSQGVLQHRHRFIYWDTALFLNLHPEHVEAHGSFERYREAKLDFFRCLKHSKKTKKYFLINNDDQDAAFFKEVAEKVGDGEIIFFSKDDVFKMVEQIQTGRSPDWFKADFNVENLAAAAAFARLRGIKQKTIKHAAEQFKGLRGRMDVIQQTPFQVVVDYAHTPDSLRAVYRNLRERYAASKKSRFICVLGSAGGGRDTWKRPEIGKIAASYCDTVVLTSEDPYDEDPQGIINEIKSGIAASESKPDKVYEIIDRKDAIKKALLVAKSGDTVVMTGKGSEPWFYLAHGKKTPWDEPELVKQLLDEKSEALI